MAILKTNAVLKTPRTKHSIIAGMSDVLCLISQNLMVILLKSKRNFSETQSQVNIFCRSNHFRSLSSVQFGCVLLDSLLKFSFLFRSKYTAMNLLLTEIVLMAIFGKISQFFRHLKISPFYV